jgi:Flp pilus assembly protein TadG
MKRHEINNWERGTAVLEFAMTAAFFFLMLVVVVAAGHLFFTHNAIVEATRRGARYAANQCPPNLPGCPNSSTTIERVKNVVLYGTPTAGTRPLVDNLQAANVKVTHSNNFGFAAGTVSVKIENYNYNFVLGVPFQMPPYQTTVAGENVGYVPANK